MINSEKTFAQLEQTVDTAIHQMMEIKKTVSNTNSADLLKIVDFHIAQQNGLMQLLKLSKRHLDEEEAMTVVHAKDIGSYVK